MQPSLSERIESLLEPVAAREGYELVAVEIAGAASAPVVRVFIDRDGGLDIDAIVAANTWVSDTLDEADPIDSAYTLEVSSPGIDRPLTRIEHFERFCGETAALKTRPVDGCSSFTGTITGVDGDTILLETKEDTVRIPCSAITKARLKGHVDFSQKGADE